MKPATMVKSLMVIGILIMIGISSAWAQNPVTVNMGKSGGHFSDTVQEKLSKFKEGVKKISQSQFAKTIGKGISAAKKGMQWAKDKYDKAMEYKKMAEDAIDSVKNSKEYKAAMLAKEIAQDTKELKKLMDKRKAKIKAIEEKYAVDEEVTKAKMEIAEENYQTGLEILKNQEEDRQEEEALRSLSPASTTQIADTPETETSFEIVEVGEGIDIKENVDGPKNEKQPKTKTEKRDASTRTPIAVGEGSFAGSAGGASSGITTSDDGTRTTEQSKQTNLEAQNNGNNRVETAQTNVKEENIADNETADNETEDNETEDNDIKGDHDDNEEKSTGKSNRKKNAKKSESQTSNTTSSESKSGSGAGVARQPFNQSSQEQMQEDLSEETESALSQGVGRNASGISSEENDEDSKEPYRLKGELKSKINLPAEKNKKGDIYNVTDTKDNYVWVENYKTKETYWVKLPKELVISTDIDPEIIAQIDKVIEEQIEQETAQDKTEEGESDDKLP